MGMAAPMQSLFDKRPLDEMAMEYAILFKANAFSQRTTFTPSAGEIRMDHLKAVMCQGRDIYLVEQAIKKAREIVDMIGLHDEQ